MDDEFSMPTRIYAFLRNLVSLDDKITLTISRGLDPFGNQVDDEGNSVDGRGRIIDTEKYFHRNGKLHEDPKRDMEFTRELGRRVVDSFMKDTVIFENHVVAWTVFEKLRLMQADSDFYRFLRTGGDNVSLPMVDVYQEVEQTLIKVRRLADKGRLKLSRLPMGGSAEDVVDKALALFGCYHTKPVLKRKGDRLFPVDMNLLYFYRNRLWGYGLETLTN